MALKPGTQVGPHEITAPLGAAGMGEVFRATDTKLKRKVAVKALPDELVGDAGRLARFERDLKLASGDLRRRWFPGFPGFESRDDEKGIAA